MANESAPSQHPVSSTMRGTFGDVVRRRPKMFFGFDHDDPRLMVAVIHCAALSPFVSASRAGGEPVAAEVLVEAGLRFTLSFNALPPPGIHPIGPGPGKESLIGDPCPLGATAAVSIHTAVEVCVDGRCWRQELAGAEPISAPRDCGTCGRTGTRATFDLDPAFFAAGAEIPHDVAELTADLGIRGEIQLSACDLAIRDARLGHRGPAAVPSRVAGALPRTPLSGAGSPPGCGGR